MEIFYSVKHISQAMGVNEETVRRWIRNGRLKSVRDSKKEGNKISDMDLMTFLNSNPKYRKAFKPVDEKTVAEWRYRALYDAFKKAEQELEEARQHYIECWGIEPPELTMEET